MADLLRLPTSTLQSQQVRLSSSFLQEKKRKTTFNFLDAAYNFLFPLP
jgi:hypothetical protein